MWSSEPRITRRAALASAAMALAGCGFVPAYGTNGGASALLGQVQVSAPRTVPGFQLAERIRDRLGAGDDQSRYRLEADLDLREIGVAVTREGAVTRFTLEGVAMFRLIDRQDGTVVLTGSTDSFTGYSTTDSTVATENARANAEERLARILADQIITRLQVGLA